jgi:hypothetical protein
VSLKKYQTLKVRISSMAKVKKMAANRRFQKGEYGTRRLYDDPTTEDIIGVIGELAFDEHYGYPMSNEYKFGDPGYDFVTALGTIDVKATMSRDKNCLVKEKDVKKGTAEFIVSAYWEPEQKDVVEFLGFEHGIEVSTWPNKSFRLKSVKTYYKPLNTLHPMWIFDHLMEWAEKLGL